MGRVLQVLTIFGAVAATAMITTLNPLPLVRDGVLLPLRLGRQVAAPAAGVAASTLTARPPAASRAAEVAVRERAACCRRLGRGEGDVGTRRLVARFQVDERRGAVMPCHGLVPAGVRMGMSVAHGWLVRWLVGWLAGCGKSRRGKGSGVWGCVDRGWLALGLAWERASAHVRECV